MARPKKEIEYDEIVRRFAGRLREVRVQRGMTQAQLADRAEVSVAYVGRLERGGAAPGVDLVARLAAALGLKAAELLPAEDPPDAKEVLRDQARLLFDGVVQTDDEALLGLLVQLLSRLSQTAASSEQDE
jgi:transcriptional regulator with XRE-family HTH domain